MSNYTRITYNLRVAGKYVGYSETEEGVMELFDDYVEANQIENASYLAIADISIEYDNVYEDYEERGTDD